MEASNGLAIGRASLATLLKNNVKQAVNAGTLVGVDAAKQITNANRRERSEQIVIKLASIPRPDWVVEELARQAKEAGDPVAVSSH